MDDIEPLEKTSAMVALWRWKEELISEKVMDSAVLEMLENLEEKNSSEQEGVDLEDYHLALFIA